MTPKEKAKQLVEMFEFETTESEIVNEIILGNLAVKFKKYKAKECALIAVKEILKSESLNYLFTKEQIDFMEFTSDNGWVHETFIDYWKKVKREIKKL